MTEPPRSILRRRNGLFGRFSVPGKDDAALPVAPASIIARNGEHPLALTIVIAIMSFFACLTLSGVGLVTSAANDWRNQIAREATIQIRPVEGIDMDQALQDAIKLVTSFAGIAEASVLDIGQTQKLLEPWLGDQVNMENLDLPRLIIVRFSDDALPDTDLIRDTLHQNMEGASFDDHRMWIDRLGGMAQTAVLSGVTVFVLTIIAMMLSVIFATRANLLMNVHIIEVLHFIGADARFVARQFDGHFLRMGFQGSLSGAIISVPVFWLLQLDLGRTFTTGEDNLSSLLFSSFSFKIGHGVALAGLVIFVTLLTIFTSRRALMRQLHEIDRRQSDFD